MQNNYHFLRKLTPQLYSRLAGSVISECYSQEKAELIIRFETKDGSFHLRANLSAAFTCLSFPKDFQRARKNSVDLFQEVIGHRVVGIEQHEHDRSFTLKLSHDLSLLFKLHGNRSNVVLYDGSVQQQLFRTGITADRDLKADQLNRTMDTSYEAFVRNQDRLPSLYFTFGKIPWAYLNDRGFRDLDIKARWDALQSVITLLENPRYYITALDGAITFSLLPIGIIQREFDDPFVAVTEFSQRYRSQEGFDIEYTRLESWLRKKSVQTGDALERARTRMLSLETYDKFKIWADLLMANLHMVPQEDSLRLPNFYNGNLPEEIRIQKDLSLQKNAAVYYGKSKKQQIEITHLENQIAQKENDLKILRDDIEALSGTSDIKIIRALAAKHPMRADVEEGESVPYHEMGFMGFRILIGKNAHANDALLQRFGYKDDLWLHAKDVPGSHVLIKHQAGKVIPKPVIERAAQMAAWYSKRKTDSLCPVSVTPRKFVRKRKGDPAGAVVVERETVIMVAPKN